MAERLRRDRVALMISGGDVGEVRPVNGDGGGADAAMDASEQTHTHTDRPSAPKRPLS